MALSYNYFGAPMCTTFLRLIRIALHFMFDCTQKTEIESSCWADYRPFLRQLRGERFPDAVALNRLIPSKALNQRGLPVRFVPASRLQGVDYESHIFETGEVSTREDNWHDLFNALVWCRMPRLKAAMNARHYQELEKNSGGRRGKPRDALTLLDESGVIVVGSDLEALQALASRDWNAAFVTHMDAWRSDLRVVVCGHSLLEKFLDPYKSMTAHALIVYAVDPFSLEQLDDFLGTALSAGGLFNSPAGLSPLPLMGIPGWWPSGEQDGGFYRDSSVFRPPSRDLAPAPIHRVSGPSLSNDPGHMKICPGRPE
jgi:hypothetical protein